MLFLGSIGNELNELKRFHADRREESQFMLVSMLLFMVMRLQVGIRGLTVQDLNSTVLAKTWLRLSSLPMMELFHIRNILS